MFFYIKLGCIQEEQQLSAAMGHMRVSGLWGDRPATLTLSMVNTSPGHSGARLRSVTMSPPLVRPIQNTFDTLLSLLINKAHLIFHKGPPILARK